jgi:hypothetical protein
LEMLSAVSEKGFSLDELVLKIRELFEQKGIAGIVSLILRLLDEKICTDITCGKRAVKQHCCDNPRYEHQDQQQRQFRTSIGTVALRWRRLRCRHCGKSIIPLRQFLGLAPYQSRTAELEKMVTEVVSEQSYRRSSSHLDIIGQIPVPSSTAHRWIVQSDCDSIDERKDRLDVLFADGTGYKRRPDEDNNINNRGELRVVLGVDKSGQITPLGAFSGISWERIASIVKGRRKGKEPVADMLVSDGERGLCEALGKLCGARQRCHWHITRDMGYMLWQDDVGKIERDRIRRELTAIIGIELPKEDIEFVRDSDKSDIMAARRHADYQIRRLIRMLLEKGYDRAAEYLTGVVRHLFSYVDRWLTTGIVSPRVSSFIERIMRELARRLKRMAFGWSPEGAAKMARIIIKRFTSADQWEKYWQSRLNIKGNVMFLLRSIKATSPQPLGR